MFAVGHRSSGCGKRIWALSIVLAITAAAPIALFGGKKKKDKNPADELTPQAKYLQSLDFEKIVWPNPPAIARIKYLNFFSGEKFKPVQEQNKPKASWMDRLSGVATGGTPQSEKLRFQLVTPYGVAVDSKGRVYVADSKVRAIFIFNTETGEVELMKNGVEARFKWLTGLAFDDADRLYAADSGMQRILIFDPQRKVEGSITEGLKSPGGVAIDNENRFLYVADAELDQILVYDADPPYKLLRTIGTRDKEHRLTSPGDFSRPTNVAVDQEGNLYVTDTWNNRVQVFDAEGKFIRTFGKAGDGPGYFARPKGIAIDSDGNVWVADSVQDRVQVFSPEGRLLIYLGGRGLLPGQFQSVTGLTIDKNNRVITSEQFPGRVQMFRYVTEAEAKAEKERREAEAQKKKGSTPEKTSAAAKDTSAK